MANYAWITRIHRFIYHRSGGRLGGNLGGNPMALMYTIGARSGEIRAIPLMYHPIDPAGIVVLASNNGQERHPAWYHNLRAHPEFDILVGPEKRRVRAEEVGPERRQELWPQMVQRHAKVEDHARNAGRELPIILLRTLKVY
jgi:deazaflavin-dependent oxidoreductase (nitroreductase family)